MKGAQDINKFKNYQAMINKAFTSKSCENQRQIKTQHSCARPECSKIFAETFNGSMVDSAMKTFMTSMYNNRNNKRNSTQIQGQEAHVAFNLQNELGNASLGMPKDQLDGGQSLDQNISAEGNEPMPTIQT